MTACNHALTGALIGLTVTNPLLALPLAFVSHFACDAVPHYDAAEPDGPERLGSRKFMVNYLLVPGTLSVLIVLCLALARPRHWLIAAICAFLAASPDLFWLPRFVHIKRTGKDKPLGRFERMHIAIQWLTGPKLIWLEAVWFVAVGALLLSRL